ncbi:MAG: dihydroorotate dehydrogenase electron transfer subunit [Eubacterium sp.]|nr:dihydroorotate dehydrogenase electron transfer subunit [Eubacterium sp.]
MGKHMLTAEVVSQSKITDDIYSLVLKAWKIAEEAVPGQFVSLYTHDSSRLLPRPISLCEVNRNKGTIRLVYRVVGSGTTEFSGYRSGDQVQVMGPLGNGFNLECREPVLMGGGIGIPPMLELAKRLSEKGINKKNLHVILGFRDTAFLADEFKKIATVHIASDTGAVGFHGNVVDLARSENVIGDMIFACGPTPMLRAIKRYAYENDYPAQLSLEEHMACGIGACLACVCKTAEVDSHFKVNTRRVCKDGPVFYAEEVEL